MAGDSDAILLESVRTHRVRLRGAFLLGGIADRRAVNDNVRRFVGGMVLAAVLCAGCVGTAFVVQAIAAQQAAQPQSTTGTP